MRRRAEVGIIVAITVCGTTALHGQAEEDQVVAVVRRALEAVSARDTATWRALTLPEARDLIVIVDGDSMQYRWRSLAESIRGLAGPGPELLERMWDPVVSVSGPIAAVWTPYDFYRDGRFSHCGIDAFHLVRTSAGWRLAAIMFTVVRARDACPPSPLGPPSGP